MEPPLHGVAASPPIRPRHDRYLSFSYSPPSSAGDELTEDDIFDTPAEPESSPPPATSSPQALRHPRRLRDPLRLQPQGLRRLLRLLDLLHLLGPGDSFDSSSQAAREREADAAVCARERAGAGEEAGGGVCEGEEEGGEVQMLPPHEMVAAWDSPVVACSVLEGVGRTLKGRDVRRVRNAVFRKTGFID